MRSHVAFGDKKAGKFPVCCRTSDPRSINDKTGCHHPPPHPLHFLSSTAPRGLCGAHPCYPWSGHGGGLPHRPSWAASPYLSCFHFQILISFLGSVYIFCTGHFSDLYIWNIATGLNLCLCLPVDQILIWNF